jgi:hypothetical protein
MSTKPSRPWPRAGTSTCHSHMRKETTGCLARRRTSPTCRCTPPWTQRSCASSRTTKASISSRASRSTSTVCPGSSCGFEASSPTSLTETSASSPSSSGARTCARCACRATHSVPVLMVPPARGRAPDESHDEDEMLPRSHVITQAANTARGAPHLLSRRSGLASPGIDGTVFTGAHTRPAGSSESQAAFMATCQPGIS